MTDEYVPAANDQQIYVADSADGSVEVGIESDDEGKYATLSVPQALQLIAELSAAVGRALQAVA